MGCKIEGRDGEQMAHCRHEEDKNLGFWTWFEPSAGLCCLLLCRSVFNVNAIVYSQCGMFAHKNAAESEAELRLTQTMPDSDVVTMRAL